MKLLLDGLMRLARKSCTCDVILLCGLCVSVISVFKYSREK